MTIARLPLSPLLTPADIFHVRKPEPAPESPTSPLERVMSATATLYPFGDLDGVRAQIRATRTQQAETRTHTRPARIGA